MTRRHISIEDFHFYQMDETCYFVTYKSPVTGKTKSNFVKPGQLIDATKNCAYPTIKNLENLKRVCKL